MSKLGVKVALQGRESVGRIMGANKTSWKKGQSGNPEGKQGENKTAQIKTILRDGLLSEAPKIIKNLKKITEPLEHIEAWTKIASYVIAKPKPVEDTPPKEDKKSNVVKLPDGTEIHI